MVRGPRVRAAPTPTTAAPTTSSLRVVRGPRVRAVHTVAKVGLDSPPFSREVDAQDGYPRLHGGPDHPLHPRRRGG
ncbi:MAG: hypothetical protein COZ96_04830 [Nitrospirae bacterium CG_4_8_14_3_um_filter_70_85]|nr:MAG: hypothetical protein COS73_01395 [Nitrospirae bacterium CG06_land_8_20_14_3_00_70_43]PIW83169.1 MAG: hypothetical protein COZ96_04830 [Nitrospirae bacterium CG_4_8_14_3_um_filter_70_85]PIX82638.1 MAG: hypothetical protein COZ33_09595 [Nitrospirae bacterium CG_4_10_14_3_um_filter_70_108]PJB96102.1 MAG: hypothetical protein CO080_04275 [Nitrospirae bacterium CG_4_9_14_0_8_um_filter_70_14]